MQVGIVSQHQYLEYTGTYKGMDFVVLFNSGGWRTAYVNVVNTPLEKLEAFDCDEYVDVHGGFTYKGCRLPFEEVFSENVSWLGWDYAHYGDGYDLQSVKKYFGDSDYLRMKSLSFITCLDYDSHIYTLLDVISECKKVIIQIKKGGTNSDLENLNN